MKKQTIIVIGLCLSLMACASSQKKIEQAREKDSKYQYNVGLVYLNNNSVDDAIKYLNRTLTLDSRFYLAYNALGLANSMKGNLQEAVRLYQKCLELAPNFSEARNNLGTVYMEMGYIDQAEAEFQKVLADASYPNKELPYYNLARLMFARQNMELALSYCDSAISLNGRFAMAYNLKGVILESQNKLPEAIESYKQAAKLVPEDVTFNFNLGAAYFKNNDFARAGEIFEAIAPRITAPDMREKLNSYLKTIREKK
jgi:tetratricopeptide (TPR) repeat protein